MAKNVVQAGRIDTVNFAPTSPRRRLPVRRAERFAGRDKELKDLERRFEATGTLAVHQVHGLSASGGVGKTELAIEFAWRALERGDFAGGYYFLPADRADPAPALAELAPAVGADPSDNVPDMARRVKAAIEGFGAPALVIVDNVSDREAWPVWLDALPGPPARLLVTTRRESLPRIRAEDMVALGRLTDEACVDLLSKFREDATEAASRESVASIIRWLDGWAVAVALVGAYMSLTPDASWGEFWAFLDAKGLPGFHDEVEGEAALVIAYHKRVEVLLAEVLGRLTALERRVVEYASLLPEDQAPTSWLTELVRDDDVEVKAKPGVADPIKAAIGRLVRLDLLRPRESEGKILALHRVLRQHVREGLGA